MKFTKYLITLCAALAISASAAETVVVKAATALAPLSLLSTKGVINYVTVMANGTNNVLYFYDSSATTGTAMTSIVYQAHTTLTSYATNWTTTTTNNEGYLLTNTWAGTYTSSATTAAATNARPTITTVMVPANATTKATLNRMVANGLTVYPTESCTIEVSYTP